MIPQAMGPGSGMRSRIRGQREATTVAASLLANQDFKLVLRRERALAEQAGSSFAVARFQLGAGAPDGTHDALARVLELFAQRLCPSDVVGRLEGESIGVLFRFTSVAEAMQEASSLCRELDAPSISCTVYGFPPFELERPETLAPVAPFQGPSPDGQPGRDQVGRTREASALT